MTTLHPKSNLELLVEEVPEDAQDFRVQTIFKPQVLFLRHGVRNDGDMEYGTSEFIELNSGNYSFIATTKTISEEQAAELVEKIRSPLAVFYKNYESNTQVCNMPKDALFSFFRSQGLDPDKKVYAILKKQ